MAANEETETTDIPVEIKKKTDTMPPPIDVENLGRETSWEEEALLLKHGLKLAWANKFIESEEFFLQGFQDKYGNTKKPSKNRRDTRGGYCLGYAIIGCVRGIAGFQKDQLDECLRRLFVAEKFIANSEDYTKDNWVGSRLSRGLCFLSIGVMYLLKKHWVHAGGYIIRAWSWISGVEKESREYEGVERNEILSLIRYLMGVFNIIVSLLPPMVVKVAELVGFPANRDYGLHELQRCYAENGFFGDLASMFLCGYNSEIKAFLALDVNEEDMVDCQKIIDLAKKEYPDSIIWAWFKSNVAFVQKKPEESISTLKCVFAFVDTYPAFELAIYWKYGLYSTMVWDFESAMKYHRLAYIKNSVDGKRRSGSPRLAYLAGVAAMMCGNVEVAKEMFEAIEEWRKSAKDDWKPLDQIAFLKCEKKYELVPILEALEMMTMTIGVKFMSETGLKHALEQLTEAYDDNWDVQHKIRYHTYIAALYIYISNVDSESEQDYIEIARDHISIAKECIPQMKDQAEGIFHFIGLRTIQKIDPFCSIPMVYYISAHIYREMGLYHDGLQELKKAKEKVSKSFWKDVFYFRIHAYKSVLKADISSEDSEDDC